MNRQLGMSLGGQITLPGLLPILGKAINHWQARKLCQALPEGAGIQLVPFRQCEELPLALGGREVLTQEQAWCVGLPPTKLDLLMFSSGARNGTFRYASGIEILDTPHKLGIIEPGLRMKGREPMTAAETRIEITRLLEAEPGRRICFDTYHLGVETDVHGKVVIDTIDLVGLLAGRTDIIHFQLRDPRDLKALLAQDDKSVPGLSLLRRLREAGCTAPIIFELPVATMSLRGKFDPIFSLKQNLVAYQAANILLTRLGLL